jgi:hypothetical protein
MVGRDDNEVLNMYVENANCCAAPHMSLMAQSGHNRMCPLSGANRTRRDGGTDANDPDRK